MTVRLLRGTKRTSSFCRRKYDAKLMSQSVRRNQQHHRVLLMDRRTEVRYQLSARVVFSWEGPEQKRFQGEGVTRDISTKGAFILTQSCPPDQAAVQMLFFLPPFHGTLATARIRAKAQVLRVEQASLGDEQCGFAVDSPGFSFSSEGEFDSESGSSLASD
jgi:hypothetical protein